MSTPQNGPSQALCEQGLGAATTASAVSRVLKAAGYRVTVYQGSDGIWVSPYPHTDEVLTYLTNKGYAAERPGGEGLHAVKVYGRRKVLA